MKIENVQNSSDWRRPQLKTLSKIVAIALGILAFLAISTSGAAPFPRCDIQYSLPHLPELQPSCYIKPHRGEPSISCTRPMNHEESAKMLTRESIERKRHHQTKKGITPKVDANKEQECLAEIEKTVQHWLNHIKEKYAAKAFGAELRPSSRQDL